MVRFARDVIVWLVCVLIAMPPQWVLAADIVPDGGTASQVSTTPSGKPMLNIAAPNGSGVSHNTFTNFNVTNQGLVVNNATGTSITSLAGAIEANPNFSGGAATLILNEVTSSNRSTLAGATEIGGQAADYILANPNGITCNGCGFINTPRATLTTGTPVLTNGVLTGLSVNGGDVAIEGLGLDASKATKFDIVTRAATINAQINAQDLGIHTGRQDFDYAARSGTAKTPDGSTKPTFAIDSTALGGMYAGRIQLVGTEEGVGVRTLGDVAASASDMVITADGKLELKSKLSAQQNIQLTSTSSDIATDKSVYAGSTLTATANAGQVQANTGGSFGAAGDVTSNAKTVAAASGGKIVAGMDNTGALTTAGNLNVNATTSIATGEGFLGGGASVTLKAPTVDLSRATDDGTETVRSRGTLTIQSSNITATNGKVGSDGVMTLTGNSPIVLGAGVYSSPNTITLTGDSVTSAATLNSDQAVNVTSTVSDITNTGSMTAGTSLTLTSAGAITNSGTIESQTGTTVTAATNLTNNSGAKFKSAAASNFTVGGALNNAGSLFSVATNSIDSPTITNSGAIAAGADLTVSTGTITNNAGVIYASNNLTVSGNGANTHATSFENSSGVVETKNGDITINAATLTNRKSVYNFTSGLVWSRLFYPVNGIVTIATPIKTVQIALPYSHYASYYEGKVTQDSAAGSITSGHNIALNGTTITNDKSSITANGDIAITATTFNNQAATLYHEAYYSSTHVSNAGLWHLFARQPVTGASGVVQAGGALNITASGGVRNATEQVYSTPPAGTDSINPADLATASVTSSLIDTAQYANLIPGQSALFVVSSAPKPKFLYETRADFVDLGHYYGSDYFLAKFGNFDPEAIPTRLGDAYFETQLVRQAIMQQTGARWLDSTVKDDTLQMKALLDGGFQAAQDLNLAFGVTLTQAQIAALTRDIIWYEEAEIDGRTVLVPRVYLAGAKRAKLDPKGTILAGHDVTIDAATIANDHGAIAAQSDITLTASGDITSTSASIRADEDIQISSTNGDVTFTAQVDTHNNNRGQISVAHEKSTLSAGGNLTVNAGDNIAIAATDMTVDGDTSLSATNDVTIGTVEVNQVVDIGAGQDRRAATSNIGSTISNGGDLTISAGGNARIKGSQVTAGGNLGVNANGDITIETSVDTFDVVAQSRKKGRFKSSSSRDEIHTVTNNASIVGAQGDVTLKAGGDLTVAGSAVRGGGDVDLEGQNVALNSVTDVNFERHSYSKSGIGFTGATTGNGASVSFGKTSSKYNMSRDERTQVVSSVAAGGDLSITATNDVKSEAATLSAGDDVTITAGNDVQISSVQDTLEFHESIQVKQAGLTVGVSENISGAVKTLANTPKALTAGEGSAGNKAVTAATAVLEAVGAVQTLTGNNLVEVSASLGTSSSQSSIDQNVAVARVGELQAGNDTTVTAGRDIKVKGARIQAERDVTLDAGRDLSVTAAENTFSMESASSSSSAGVKASAGVGFTGYNMGVSAYASASDAQRADTTLTHTNAQIAAGRDVTLKSGRDAELKGANVAANRDLGVDVGGDLTVASTQNTRDISGYSSSFNASIGASTSGQLPGSSATPSAPSDSNNGSLGFTSGSETGTRRFTDDQTSLIAGGNVDVRVGGHTQLDGAVVASTGGDVAIDTNTFGFKDLADVDTYRNSTIGASVSASVGQDGEGKTQTTPDGTLTYAKQTQDIEGVTRATVAAPAGTATITIRANPDQGLDGLNQTLAKAQEITRNERTNVRIVIDTATIRKLPETVQTLGDAFDATLNQINALTSQDMAFGEATAKQADILNEARREAIRLGMSRDEAAAFISDTDIQNVVITTANINEVEAYYAQRGVDVPLEERMFVLNGATPIIKDGTLYYTSPSRMEMELVVNDPNISGSSRYWSKVSIRLIPAEIDATGDKAHIIATGDVQYIDRGAGMAAVLGMAKGLADGIRKIETNYPGSVEMIQKVAATTGELIGMVERSVIYHVGGEDALSSFDQFNADIATAALQGQEAVDVTINNLALVNALTPQEVADIRTSLGVLVVVASTKVGRGKLRANVRDNLKRNGVPTPAAEQASEIYASNNWIEKYEGGTFDGHTIRNHVGKTESDLFKRFDIDPNASASSSYATKVDAENAIQKIIVDNKADFEKWLADPSSDNTLPLKTKSQSSSPLGISVKRGEVNAKDAYNARALFRKDGNGGFTVITSYPEL